MKTQIRRKIKHSLLIEDKELTSLYSFIRSKYSKAEITAECNDDSQLETEEISDITNFENPNYRKITSITVNARNSYEDTLRIHINSTWPSDPVQFTINSQNDEGAVYIGQEIVKLFSEMKPGYDLLARISVFAILILLSGYSLLRTAAILFGFIKPAPPLPNELSGIEGFNLIVLLVLVLLAILALLEKLRMTLFPKVFFMIGKQKKENGKVDKMAVGSIYWNTALNLEQYSGKFNFRRFEKVIMSDVITPNNSFSATPDSIPFIIILFSHDDCFMRSTAEFGR